MIQRDGSIIIFFEHSENLSLICNMKSLILLISIPLLFGSCTSEYDERLSEAKELHQRYLKIEENNMFSPNADLVKELDKIQSEIDYLAKVSGNEHMFFRDLED